MTLPYEAGPGKPHRVIERKIILMHDYDATDVDEFRNTVRCRYCKKCIFKLLELNMVPSNLWYGPQGHVALCPTRRMVAEKGQLPE